MGRWDDIHAKYIKDADQRSANLQADWFRKLHTNTTINNTPLIKYAELYNNFAQVNDIKRFFKEVLLQKLRVDEDTKEKITAFLAKTFHQGAFLSPVSGPLSVSIIEPSHADESATRLAATLSSPELVLKLTTNSTGFSIEEQVNAKTLRAIPGASLEQYSDPEQGYKIFPEAGKDYVIKAQGKINLNFIKDPQNPNITIESNNISYGHSKIQSLHESLGKERKTLGQRIVDFFKKMFNLTNIKELQEQKITESATKRPETLLQKPTLGK